MGNKVKSHILRASRRFEQYLPELETIMGDAVEQTGKHIPLHPIDIVVYDNPAHAIPGFAHGARTHNPYTIRISLDPLFLDFIKAVRKELPRSVSHELHHAVRWKAVGYGRTLMEVLVTEGLATCFEVELWGGKPSPWATAIKGKTFEKLWQKATQEFKNTSYNHNRWFFGSDDLPRWAGYTLGHDLVRRYLAKHPTESAASLVATPAAEIAKILG